VFGILVVLLSQCGKEIFLIMGRLGVPGVTGKVSHPFLGSFRFGLFGVSKNRIWKSRWLNETSVFGRLSRRMDAVLFAKRTGCLSPWRASSQKTTFHSIGRSSSLPQNQPTKERTPISKTQGFFSGAKLPGAAGFCI